jgi:hypothetical protein
VKSRPRPTDVSEHAVERYIERWRPDLQRRLDLIEMEARRDLERLAAAAEFTGVIDSQAQAIWKVNLATPCAAAKDNRRHAVTMLICEQGERFSTVLPIGSKAPNRRPRR